MKVEDMWRLLVMVILTGLLVGSIFNYLSIRALRRRADQICTVGSALIVNGVQYTCRPVGKWEAGE